MSTIANDPKFSKDEEYERAKKLYQENLHDL